MQWWIRPGPSRCWAIRKPAPRAPSSASCGSAHVLVDDLGVAAVGAEALVRVLHRRHVAQDLHARRVDRHDEHRRALVAVRVGVGDGHHDQEVGHRRVGREPLAAVDHPPVAVLDRARLEQRRVAARRCPARSSRTPSAGRRPAAGAATAPSGRRCRPARAPPSCPSPAPGCRTPPARTGSTPRISCISPSLTWPKPWPPSSGGRWAAHRPRSRTALLQRRHRALEAVLAELVEHGLDRPDLVAHERPASSRAAPGTRARWRSPMPVRPGNDRSRLTLLRRMPLLARRGGRGRARRCSPRPASASP